MALTSNFNKRPPVIFPELRTKKISKVDIVKKKDTSTKQQG